MKHPILIVFLSFILFQSCFAQKNEIAERDSTPPNNSATSKPISDNFKSDKPNRLSNAKTVKDSSYEAKIDSPQFSGLLIEMDERIDLLAKAYMSSKRVKGYKVQIFSGQSRWEASKVKSEFISSYPKLPTPELIYHTPNFKLRVGNFRDRFEAEKHLRSLKETFPSAFIVKDDIKLDSKK